MVNGVVDGQPLVTVVGIGDEGPAGLGEEARAAIERAEVLAGGRRHLACFSGHPAAKLVIASTVRDLVAEIERRASDRRVVVLASGDPLFFGIGSLLGARLGPRRVRVLPHVGAVQLAFARIATAWHDATVLSAHGRPLESIIRPALDAAKVAILTDAANTPAAIAGALLEAGMEDCRAVVCEHLGGPQERVVETSLSGLQGRTFDALNVLLLLRERPERPTLALGLPDDSFAHLRGQITKAEVRAVSLSRLRLRRGDTVWDVGAGSGSVGIEAALLTGGRVFAVERSTEQAAMLRENVARFHAHGVQIVEGEAPEALAQLPAPDAAFVGGSGGRLTDVLEAVASRLRPRGSLALNLTTLDHLASSRAWLAARGWVQDLVQLQVARAAPIAGDERLVALNPIWILAARRGVTTSLGRAKTVGAAIEQPSPPDGGGS